MAKVKEIRIAMSRKISDDNYGSFGVQGEIFLVLEEGEDKDEMWAYGTSWLSSKLAGTHKAHGTVSSQPKEKKPVLPAQPQQSGLLDSTTKTFPVESITVDIKGGKRYAKAKGGSFKMYGVNVWDEVAAMPPLEWNLQEMDGAEFTMEPGVVAIYVEKTLDSGKVVPDKVTGWA